MLKYSLSLSQQQQQQKTLLSLFIYLFQRNETKREFNTIYAKKYLIYNKNIKFLSFKSSSFEFHTTLYIEQQQHIFPLL